MFRYVAFVWHDEDPSARGMAARLIERHAASGQEWKPALHTRGLYVGYAGERPGSSEPYVLHSGAGVVLGKLFSRGADGESKPVHRNFP